MCVAGVAVSLESEDVDELVDGDVGGEDVDGGVAVVAEGGFGVVGLAQQVADA